MKKPNDLSMLGHESKTARYSQEDILHYFERLCIFPFHKIPQDEEIQRVLEITQGNPLSVMILAHRYCRTREKHMLVENTEDLSQVTEVIQRLITQHASETPAQRSKLYSLALLKTVDNPRNISDALGIGRESKYSYNRSLHRLYQDYGFLFTDDSHQYFQEDMRDFLRYWLLTQREEPEICTIIRRIHENQQRRLQDMEERNTYQSLQERLNDESWIEIFQDLVEIQFWINPSEGVHYGITLMLAASLYRPSLIHDIANIGLFFVAEMATPQFDWWRNICQGLGIVDSSLQTFQKIEVLEGLIDLTVRQKILIPSPLTAYSQLLIAAVWWQQGELYRYFDPYTALSLYIKALSYVVPEENVSTYAARLHRKMAEIVPEPQLQIDFLTKAIELQPDFAVAHYELGNVYFDQEQYQLARVCYQYVIELKPHHVDTWINLGVIYTRLKDYQRALGEFAYAQSLDSENVWLYYNRANVYRELGQYEEALKDFDKAIALDNTFASAYLNRGNVYAALKIPELARLDYVHTSRLRPDDIHPLWLQEWIQFGRERVTYETGLRLQKIAAIDPHHYLAVVCIGIAKGLMEKDLRKALLELELACGQAPDQWDSYFWLAMLAAYLGRSQQAAIALNKAVQLGLPTSLLLPLYWLEKDRPDFFKRYGAPILQGANL